MREKRRYIKFVVDSDKRFDDEDVRHSLWGAMLSFIGENGAARTNLWLSNWDEKSNTGVLRCSIIAVDEVIVCMKLVTEIQEERVNFIVKGVSGTLKSLETC